MFVYNMENLMDKINGIKDILHKYQCIYVPIYNNTSLNNIYELFANNIIFEPTHIVDHVYLGIYYDIIQKDETLMKKYYEYAFDNNDLYAIYYYCKYIQTTKDNEKMKTYLMLGLEKGITMLAGYVGIYYQYMNIDYDLAIKYYNMVIDDNDNIMDILNKQYSYTTEDYVYTQFAIKKIKFEMMKMVFYNLGSYYQNIDIDYDLMETYYTNAIEMGNELAMNMLGYYYMNIKKDLKMAKYYFLESVTHGNNYANTSLGIYYRNKKKYDLMKQYFLKTIVNDKMVLYDMVTHFIGVESNYKMAKMYVFMYYAFDNGICIDSILCFDSIDEYYRDWELNVLLLEYYMNAQDKMKREIIIESFNDCVKLELSIKDKIIFDQLVNEFEFKHDDVLCIEMIEIVGVGKCKCEEDDGDKVFLF